MTRVRFLLLLTAGLITGFFVRPMAASSQADVARPVDTPMATIGHFDRGLSVLFKNPPGAASTKPKKAKPMAPAVVDPLFPAGSKPAIILPPIFHDTAIPTVKNGLAPVIISLPTTQKVVFLGIDDGGNKTQSEIDLLARYNIHASLFLADLFVGERSDFFKGFLPSGSMVEDHSLNHLQMSRLAYRDQVREICGEADLEERQFGRRPTLFRPPFGDYNENTRRAAATCGMKAVVLWIAKANGGSMQYQVGNGLRPGDIVLMHFRPEFAQDLKAFIEAQNAAGLHTELLEDWLPAS